MPPEGSDDHVALQVRWPILDPDAITATAAVAVARAEWDSHAEWLKVVTVEPCFEFTEDDAGVTWLVGTADVTERICTVCLDAEHLAAGMPSGVHLAAQRIGMTVEGLRRHLAAHGRVWAD